MDNFLLSFCYQLVGELLMHPDERDGEQVQILRSRLEQMPASIRDPLQEFLNDPVSASAQEYVATLELSPPCSLYLGTYLFEEPKTCRDVGTSGRNAYMLELSGVYRHFGFDLSGRELPDFLPAVVDFLWISLERPQQDEIGLRRRLLEHYVLPGLEPLHKKLSDYQSPYALLVAVLTSAVEADIGQMSDVIAWQPPADTPEFTSSLPCQQGADRFTCTLAAAQDREQAHP